ncbi:hypothetical protein K4P50_11110 [Staphylococcus epidermidis]|nr:hypothetical protein [Staphylococcus epidermidis]
MGNETEENKDDLVKVRHDYGMRANLRIGVMTLVMRIDFLEKLFSIKYNMTWKRFWTYMAELFILWTTVVMFLSSNTAGFSYVGIWILLIAAFSTILLGYHAFLLPSGGSLFSSVFSYVLGLIKYYSIRFGWINPPTKTKIHNTDQNGIIEFTDGGYGVLLLMDGMTSATAFPKEIKNLENRSRSYQNARNRTTTEFNITSSQRQDVTEQIKSNKALKKQTQNKAFKAVINTRVLQYDKDLNGKYSTVVQHKMLRDNSLRELNVRLETLERYTSDGGGLYYAADRLTKEETDEFFKNFYGFK